MRLQPFKLTIIATVLGACVLQACASAPLNLNSQSEPTPSIAVQDTLRTAASSLTVTARQEGWQLEDDRQAGAFALLGRLVTGESGGEAADDTAGEPVDLYLARHGDGAGAALLADITLAGALVRDVVEAGRAVVASEADLSREAIDRDIAQIEAALISARRARAFFAAVRAESDAAGPPRRDMQLRTALMALDDRIETLAITADALAARRWGNNTSTLS